MVNVKFINTQSMIKFSWYQCRIVLVEVFINLFTKEGIVTTSGEDRVEKGIHVGGMFCLINCYP